MCPEKDEISTLSAERAVFYAKQNPKGLLKEIKEIAEESGGKEAYIANVYLDGDTNEILEEGTTPVSEVLQHILSGENVMFEVYKVGRKGTVLWSKTLYYANFVEEYVFYGISTFGAFFNISVYKEEDYYSFGVSGYFLKPSLLNDGETPLVLYYNEGYGTNLAYRVCEISGNTSSVSADTLYLDFAQKRPIILYRRGSDQGFATFKMLELLNAFKDMTAMGNPSTIIFVEKSYSRDGSVSYTRYRIVGTTVTQIS